MNVIPTFYNGIEYRSKTEARWAVFLNDVGVKSQYEPECFILPGGYKYMPDFYIPDYKGWIEVKGTTFTKKEKWKCEQLCLITKQTVMMADGWPDYLSYNAFYYDSGEVIPTMAVPSYDKGYQEKRFFYEPGINVITDDFKTPRQWEKAIIKSQNERFNWA